jgi:hypothetical protein
MSVGVLVQIRAEVLRDASFERCRYTNRFGEWSKPSLIRMEIKFCSQLSTYFTETRGIQEQEAWLERLKARNETSGIPDWL